MNRSPEDVDKTFERMVESFGYDPEQDALLWMFGFRLDEVTEKLSRFGGELADRFAEEFNCDYGLTPTGDQSGSESMMLMLTTQSQMSRDRVKLLLREFEELAQAQGVDFEGFYCIESVAGQEFEGPMNAEEAASKLRHFTDCGLPEGALLHWILAFTATDPAVAESFEGVLREAGFDDLERSENEEDAEEREYYIDAVLLRSNTEAGLAEQHAAAEKLAASHGVRFEGFQFADPQPEEPES